MKRFFPFILTTVCLAIMFATPSVKAATPWEWEMTLQETEEGRVMHMPTSIYIDEGMQRYYVADRGENQLLSYDRNGEFLSKFTAGKKLEAPFDLVREPGIIWIIEKGRNSVTMVDLNKKNISPRRLTDNDKKIYPDRLEIDGKTLYLLDKASGTIFSLDRKLQIKDRFSCRDCSGGFVDFKIKNKKLWALEQSGKTVYRFSLNGDLEERIKLDASAIDFPRSIAVDDNDLLFILDRHKGRIVVFDTNGHKKYSFLEAGQARGQLYYPIELKFDPWGRLCVVEEGNGRVQIFSHR